VGFLNPLTLLEQACLHVSGCGLANLIFGTNAAAFLHHVHDILAIGQPVVLEHRLDDGAVSKVLFRGNELDADKGRGRRTACVCDSDSSRRSGKWLLLVGRGHVGIFGRVFERKKKEEVFVRVENGEVFLGWVRCFL